MTPSTVPKNDNLEKVAAKLTPGLPDVGISPLESSAWLDSPQMAIVALEKSAKGPLALSLTLPIQQKWL